MKKRLLALICALCLLGGCSPSPTAITVNSSKVDAAELAFYLEYNRLNLENRYGGSYADGVYDKAITETVKKDALDQIVTAELVLQKCKEYKLKLTEDDKAYLKDNKDSLMEGQGGKAGYLKFLKDSAMTDRVYDKFQSNALYYDKLFDYLVGEQGKHIFADEALRQFFSDNYAQVQYIRFSLTDSGGNSISEVDAAEKMTRAEQVLAQAHVPGADFTQLVGLYNDDTYMSSNSGGIVLTAAQCADSPQFENVFSLKDNEVDHITVGADGYYIVKRLPLSAGYFDANKDSITQNARDAKFSELLEGWKKDSKITTTSLYDKMNLTNLRDYVI